MPKLTEEPTSESISESLTSHRLPLLTFSFFFFFFLRVSSCCVPIGCQAGATSMSGSVCFMAARISKHVFIILSAPKQPTTTKMSSPTSIMVSSRHR